MPFSLARQGVPTKRLQLDDVCEDFAFTGESANHVVSGRRELRRFHGPYPQLSDFIPASISAKHVETPCSRCYALPKVCRRRCLPSAAVATLELGTPRSQTSSGLAIVGLARQISKACREVLDGLSAGLMLGVGTTLSRRWRIKVRKLYSVVSSIPSLEPAHSVVITSAIPLQ